MRKTSHTITILLFFTSISAESYYTLSLFLISRFKSLRNVFVVLIIESLKTGEGNGKKYASRSPIGRPPHHKDFLRKRVFRLLGRSRENPFVWGYGPAGFGIITIFSCYIENKGSQCYGYQLEGGYRCIKTHIYNIDNTPVTPSQHKRKLFHPLSSEYQLDHQSFTHHFFQNLYSRLTVLSIQTFNILQEVLPVKYLH